MIKTIYIDEFNIIHENKVDGYKELTINFPDIIYNKLYDSQLIYRNTFIENKETFNIDKAQVRKFEIQELINIERNKLLDCLEYVLVKVAPPYNPMVIHTQMEKYRNELKDIQDKNDNHKIIISTYDIIN